MISIPNTSVTATTYTAAQTFQTQAPHVNGFLAVANAAVYIRATVGLQGTLRILPEFLMTPGILPISKAFGGAPVWKIEVRAAATGTTLTPQVWGVLTTENEIGIQSPNQVPGFFSSGSIIYDEFRGPPLINASVAFGANTQILGPIALGTYPQLLVNVGGGNLRSEIDFNFDTTGVVSVRTIVLPLTGAGGTFLIPCPTPNLLSVNVQSVGGSINRALYIAPVKIPDIWRMLSSQSDVLLFQNAAAIGAGALATFDIAPWAGRAKLAIDGTQTNLARVFSRDVTGTIIDQPYVTPGSATTAGIRWYDEIELPPLANELQVTNTSASAGTFTIGVTAMLTAMR